MPIGKYLGTSLLLWGLCLCLMAACTSFTGAAIVRLLLGILEAGIMPSCMVISACWYRREEQPLRAALWFGPFSGIFGGILAYAIGRMQISIPVWKALFLIYGGSTVFFGIVCLLFLPDTHDNAWFLSRAEQKEAKLRTADNNTGLDLRKNWNSAQIVEALKDPKYWVVVSFGIFQCITNAGITNFNPLILLGFGYSKPVTVLLAAPHGGLALVVQVIASILALYVQNIRCLLWTISCIPALVGVLMVRFIDVQTHRIAALMGLYLTSFYNVSWVMAMSLVSSNTAGATKKSFASVSMAISYAIGNMIGPQFFLDSQKPHYTLGVGAMIFSFVMMGICGVLYWRICMHQNQRRDREGRESRPLLAMGALAIDDLDDEAESLIRDTDKTDFEIPTFRYTY